MTDPLTPAFFDGHNDMLLKLWRAEAAGGAPERMFEFGCSGHLDLPRLRAGGFGGGLFAIFAPSAEADMAMDGPEGYDVALPPPLDPAEARAAVLGQAGILLRLDAQGLLRLCRTAAEIEAAMAGGEVAAVMHLEGAEAIDPAFRVLDVLHAAGLRSLGPVWSRPNAFGHGVPFRFPSGPDTGPGLTGLGRELVRQCAARKILLDVSHLNAAGFDDLAAEWDGPFVASHSNAHALCPQSRNLIARQLDMIRERDGLVGVNLATAFLRPDGRMADLDDIGPVVDQFLHLIEALGEDRVGLGSDWDGALTPAPLQDPARLPALRMALAAAGVDAPLLDKLARGNWIRVLRAVWGA